MLGIIKNRSYYWRNALRALLEDFVEVISFGHLTLIGFKIVKWKIDWSCSLVYFGHHLVTVLSFGYLTTDWTDRYWKL